jgi:hypothetical protein
MHRLVGSCIEQKLNDAGKPDYGSLMQHAPAIHTCSAKVRAPFEEQLHYRHTAVQNGFVQRRVLTWVDRIQVRVMVDQELNHLRIADARSQLKLALSVAIGHLLIGSRFKQQLNGRRVCRNDRVLKRRFTRSGPGIHIRTVVDEDADDLGIARPSRNLQRGVTQAIRRIDGNATRKKPLDLRYIAGPDRPLKHSGSIGQSRRLIPAGSRQTCKEQQQGCEAHHGLQPITGAGA